MRRLADCHCLVLRGVGLIPLAVTNRIESNPRASGRSFEPELIGFLIAEQIELERQCEMWELVLMSSCLASLRVASSVYPQVKRPFCFSQACRRILSEF
jgi:hypothetical protein